jgi:hypothetical protein
LPFGGSVGSSICALHVAPASLKEAVAMLKSSNSTVTLTVLRKL